MPLELFAPPPTLLVADFPQVAGLGVGLPRRLDAPIEILGVDKNEFVVVSGITVIADMNDPNNRPTNRDQLLREVCGTAVGQKLVGSTDPELVELWSIGGRIMAVGEGLIAEFDGVTGFWKLCAVRGWPKYQGYLRINRIDPHKFVGMRFRIVPGIGVKAAAWGLYNEPAPEAAPPMGSLMEVVKAPPLMQPYNRRQLREIAVRSGMPTICALTHGANYVFDHETVNFKRYMNKPLGPRMTRSSRRIRYMPDEYLNMKVVEDFE